MTHTLQHTATHRNTPHHAIRTLSFFVGLQITATNCSTMQHTATHRNTPHHATRTLFFLCLCVCNLLCMFWLAFNICMRVTGLVFVPHTSTHWNTLHHTAPHCNTLHHTATYCHHLRILEGERYNMKSLSTVFGITLQHTAIHCNTLQHTAT